MSSNFMETKQINTPQLIKQKAKNKDVALRFLQFNKLFNIFPRVATSPDTMRTILPETPSNLSYLFFRHHQILRLETHQTPRQLGKGESALDSFISMCGGCLGFKPNLYIT